MKIEIDPEELALLSGGQQLELRFEWQEESRRSRRKLGVWRLLFLAAMAAGIGSTFWGG